MPRTILAVTNQHDGKSETYEGVLLEELLRKAGARRQLMTTYVVAAASDGYKVVFAMAELDSDFMSSQVLVADTIDGAPIDSKRGPFRLVAPHDKRPARWVRMLNLRGNNPEIIQLCAQVSTKSFERTTGVS